MNKITISNDTSKILIVKYLDQCHEIDVGDKIKIEIDDSNKNLHIYQKRKQFSMFYLGKFLSKEELINTWILGPILFIAFDSFFEVPNGIRILNISERKYHYLMFIIFNILLVDDKYTDSYQYHKSVDKKKFEFLSTVTIAPLAVICLCLLLVGIFGLIFEFSFAAIFISLISIAFLCLFISIAKTARRFEKIDKYAQKVISDSKPIIVLNKIKRIVSYTEKLEDKTKDKSKYK